MAASLKRLQQLLGYQFKQVSVLEQALTHRSFDSAASNERLEFLGDSILNFLMAEKLYAQYGKAREGELTRLRASLVCEATLVRLAQAFKLGEFIRFGVGEQRSGGGKRASILADAMEALIGAIYCDGGIAACREVLMQWYQPLMDDLDEQSLEVKDAKTRLQEYCQAQKKPLPVYEVVEISGAMHAQRFKVVCRVEEIESTGEGAGGSKRKAEQLAAEALLARLKG